MVRMRKPLRAYSQAQSEENTLPNRQETQGDRHRACIAAVLQNLLTLLPWLKINTSRVPAFQITAIEGFAGGSSGIAPASRRRDLFRARLKSAEESCAGSVAPRGKNTPLSLPRGAPWCSFHILGREHNGPYFICVRPSVLAVWYVYHVRGSPLDPRRWSGRAERPGCNERSP